MHLCTHFIATTLMIDQYTIVSLKFLSYFLDDMNIWCLIFQEVFLFFTLDCVATTPQFINQLKKYLHGTCTERKRGENYTYKREDWNKALREWGDPLSEAIYMLVLDPMLQQRNTINKITFPLSKVRTSCNFFLHFLVTKCACTPW
jgi:hypothetical protein